MRLARLPQTKREEGSILVFFLFTVVILMSIAGIASYHAGMTRLAHRRVDMVQATQIAEGSAAIACAEVQWAVTNRGFSSFAAALEGNPAGAYSLNATLSNSTNLIYSRIVSAPFTDQSVYVQISFENSKFPPAASVQAVATIGHATVTTPATPDPIN